MIDQVIFGNLADLGIEVYVENGLVYECDDRDCVCVGEATPENIASAIRDAEQTLRAWAI